MIGEARFRRIRAVLERRQPDLTVLLESVNKSHNLSAIVRSCDAVGVSEVHAVPAQTGLSLDGVVSAGSSNWVKLIRHPDTASAIRGLQERGFQVVAAHPARAAVDFREIDYTRPTAILMGAELPGVDEETRALADRTAVVPMAGMVRSLNVSVATALFLYEAQRQRAARGMYERSRIPPEERKRLLFEWCYPEFARAFRERGLPYPALSEIGEIVGSLEPLKGG